MSENMKEQELEQVAGGANNAYNQRRVAGLQTGYLAMRRAPTYDYGNEIRGAELYNGDVVYIQGSFVQGGDGRTYVWVFSPKSGVSGYVNAAFLR